MWQIKSSSKPFQTKQSLTFEILTSLMTHFRLSSFRLTNMAFPKEPSPIILIFAYFSIFNESKIKYHLITDLNFLFKNCSWIVSSILLLTFSLILNLYGSCSLFSFIIHLAPPQTTLASFIEWIVARLCCTRYKWLHMDASSHA